jgi:hypothetical protein
MKPATAGVSEYTLPPAAALPAVCVAVIDMGTHTRPDFDKSKPPKDHPMVALVWELHWREDGDEEQTALMVRDYTCYFSENSNLRKIAKASLGTKCPAGDSFDPILLLGSACSVTIEHKKSGDRTFANISGIGALTFGTIPPTPVHTPVMVELTDRVPEWVPWIFGETVADRRGRCHELRGQAPPAGEEISEEGEGPAESRATITGDEQTALRDLFERKGQSLERWLKKAGFADISKVTLASYETIDAALSKMEDLPF